MLIISVQIKASAAGTKTSQIGTVIFPAALSSGAVDIITGFPIKFSLTGPEIQWSPALS